MNKDKSLGDSDGGGLQGYFDELLVAGSPVSLNMVAGTDFVTEPDPIQVSPAQPRPEPRVRKYLDANRPHWAQQQFDAIIICSRGHHYAVPLQDLLSVGLLSSAEAGQFHQSGALSIAALRSEGPAYIAHIAKLLLLEEYQGEAQEQLAYLLVLKDSEWGLAVDSVSDRLRIDPDSVNWQVNRGNRPWVAGSLFESHYPLLDLRQLVPVLSRLLPRP